MFGTRCQFGMFLYLVFIDGLAKLEVDRRLKNNLGVKGLWFLKGDLMGPFSENRYFFERKLLKVSQV